MILIDQSSQTSDRGPILDRGVLTRKKNKLALIEILKIQIFQSFRV